ncbi:ATPase/histidine kinase/DNA gyrase B/HSP90 domain protein [Clostridiales bacterium 1_7_47FAA]|nr:ATPase/histidine kinase/DNA gyrase B/HSP90 domain protein [Clostridiales bacterium 1_7_47FAA]
MNEVPAMSTTGYINISLELFGGLLSLIFILSLSLGSLKKERLERLYIRVLSINTILLFSDAAAWIFKGHPDRFSFWMVRIANFLVFTFGYILLAVFTDYLVCFVSGKGAGISRAPSRLMWWLALSAIVLVVISQYNHMYYLIDSHNVYHRQRWFWISQIYGIICMLINGAILARYRKYLSGKELAGLAAYILMPVIAMLVQMLIYGIAVLYIATTVSALCIYISIQVEQSRKFSQEELELEKSRTAIMLSQIHPHFLYNSLSVIKGLCQTDPRQAELAVDHFSGFLRGNLDSLTAGSPIPFSQELSHTRHYLELEQMRFGHRLNVIYDTPVTDFLIPPLTLQPIVENAVRHGIVKCEEGGTLTVATALTSDAYTVTVTDDGVGFDPSGPLQDGKKHIGIQNVRKRLQAQCSASLTIRSVRGCGTTAMITLPRKAGEK